MDPQLELIGFEHRAHDHQFAHLTAHVHRGEQILDEGRHGAEAIAQLVAQIIEILQRFRPRHAAVQDQAFGFVRHVAVGDIGGDTELEFGLEVRTLRLSAQFPNRLFHHLGVQLESDRGNVARLLAPEQVAGSTQFQVVHRQLESAARLNQFAQHFDASFGVARDQMLARHQQVGVSSLLGAAHPPAQLVELGQPEVVGAIDYDSVGVGNIQPRFHYRRADQDVDAVVDKVVHHDFQLPFLHLPVSDRDLSLGHQRAQMTRHVFDVLDPVMDEEHLTAAVEFAQDDLADEAIVEIGDVGMNRLAVHRRGLDDGQVANPQHRHVQGARNRRAGHRQHVNQLAEFLDLLLVGDAEAMFFVDYQQPQALEIDVRLQQTMGADHDIDLALTHHLQHCAVFFGRVKARDHLDAHGEIPEAPAEGFVMLLGEHRGRHQHRDLVA